jgi:hypothetical protein
MKLLIALLVPVGLVVALPAYAKSKDQDGANPPSDKDFCAVYGDGYQRAPGTDTCVKVSGYVRENASKGDPGSNP